MRTLSLRPAALATIVLLAAALTGCSAPSGGTPSDANPAGTDSTPTPEPPLSLVGEWKATNSEAEDAWQSAVITDDTISVDWVAEGGDTTAIFWIGSYIAPTEATTTYEWESIGDTEKMSTALMASQEEKKRFSYDDGVLTYEVSMMGVSKQITMERVD